MTIGRVIRDIMSERPLTVLLMPESAYGPTSNRTGIGDVLRLGPGAGMSQRVDRAVTGDPLCSPTLATPTCATDPISAPSGCAAQASFVCRCDEQPGATARSICMDFAAERYWPAAAQIGVFWATAQPAVRATAGRMRRQGGR
jgi:hypothetical protein